MPFIFPEDPNNSLGMAEGSGQLSTPSPARPQSNAPTDPEGSGDRGQSRTSDVKKERLADVVLSDCEGEFGPRTSSPDRGWCVCKVASHTDSNRNLRICWYMVISSPSCLLLKILYQLCPDLCKCC